MKVYNIFNIANLIFGETFLRDIRLNNCINEYQ